MANNNCLVLSNGKQIPKMGYGTGVIRRYSRNKFLAAQSNLITVLRSIKHLHMMPNLKMDIWGRRIIKNAFDSGFRLFDTGRIYGYSEKMIGEALNAVIDRNSIYIATKISDMDLDRHCSPATVRGNLDISLNYLKTNYVDAYLLHWPHGKWIDIYLEMEKEYLDGRVRALGVCNFDISHFEQLAERCTIMPHICQTELHPLNTKPSLRKFCSLHGITLMAHTPVARMCKKITNNKTMHALAKKYNKSIAQIIIKWHIQNKIIPIVATMSTHHMLENLDYDDFELTNEEMAQIDAMNEDLVLLLSNGVAANGIDDPNYIYNL